MQITPSKPLREQQYDVRSAIYQRLGLPVGRQHENEMQATEFWCRHCRNRFSVGSIRIRSAPRPHWYEMLCPGRNDAGHDCDGSWEDFHHRSGKDGNEA